jgi:hypothetical protein
LEPIDRRYQTPVVNFAECGALDTVSLGLAPQPSRVR